MTLRFVSCGVLASCVCITPSGAQMERAPYSDSKNDGVGYETIVVDGCYRNFAPIHIAAARGDVARLKQELAEGVPVDLLVVNQGGSGHWRGTTPLMWAAMTGNVEGVHILIAAGADVNASSSTGLTPLMAAAGAVPTVHGDELARMTALVKAGGDVNATDDAGNSALAYACGVSNSIENPPKEKIQPHLVDDRPTQVDLIRPGVGGSIGISIERRSPRVVFNGDVERVQTLLEAGADVNQMNEGSSLLSRVIHYTDASRLKLLLDHGADVGFQSSGGWNALMVAAAYGDWPCFKLLLDAGADINAIDRRNGNQTVLIWAIRGQEDAGKKVRALVEAGADLHAKSDCASSLLLLAAGHRFGESVEVLLNAGFDPAERDEAGQSALHLAAENCDAVGVKALLTRAVFDISEKTPAPGLSTALHLAARSEHDSAAKVRLLLDAEARIDELDGSGMTPLLRAASAGNMDAVELLANAGAEVSHVVPPGVDNWNAQPGMSALHLVANRGGDHVFMSQATGERAARALIARGADLDLQDSRHRTALLLALNCKNFEVAKILLAVGADPGIAQDHKEAFDDFEFHHRESPLCAAIAADAPTDFINLIVKRGVHLDSECEGGATPLHLAAKRLSFDVMQLLVNHGADVNKKDDQGLTPLIVLVGDSWDPRIETRREKDAIKEVVQWLIEKGAKLEAKDDMGRTALMHAGKPDMVRILVELKADVHATDHEGATPLMLASRMQSLDAIRILKEAGADVNARDKHGETPLMYAGHAYIADACRLLVKLGADPALRNDSGHTALDIAQAEHRSPIDDRQTPAQYLESIAVGTRTPDTP